jgi:hypothetical protein
MKTSGTPQIPLNTTLNSVKLHYAIQDYEAELIPLVAAKLLPMPDNTVQVRQQRLTRTTRTTVAAYSVLARLVGLALVWDTRERHVELIGSSTCFDFWPRGRFRSLPAAVEALECLALPDPAWPAVRRMRQHRLNLLAVQHRVCRLHPRLRKWRPNGRQPGQEEVWLRTVAAVPGRSTGHRLHLGGAVWVADYYTSGQFLVDLGAESSVFRKFGLDLPGRAV